MARLPLALTALLLIGLVGCGVGSSSEPEPTREHPPGLWFDTRFAQGATTMPIEEWERIRQLGALGYAQAYPQPEQPEALGVTDWEPELAQDGFNLYCSGHAAHAYLMDMRGTVVHEWSFDYPSLEHAPTRKSMNDCWRRVRLLPDGGLLAVYEDSGLLRIDRDSRLVWFRPNGAHHDVQLRPDGHILTLAHREDMVPYLNPNAPVVQEWIEEFDGEGTLLRRVSLLDCLMNSPWKGEVVESARRSEDILHSNSLELLGPLAPGAHPAFRPGRVLVCLRNIDALVLVDLAQEKAVWFAKGSWRSPHEARLLEQGDILLFDNMGNEGYSRVIEIDPRVLSGSPPTGSTSSGAAGAQPGVRLCYAGQPARDFFSVFCGSAERLADGNTLISETCAGRAFEVTQEGRIVWRFTSPHRAGEHQELVAALFEVERIALERVAWLPLAKSADRLGAQSH